MSFERDPQDMLTRVALEVISSLIYAHDYSRMLVCKSAHLIHSQMLVVVVVVEAHPIAVNVKAPFGVVLLGLRVLVAVPIAVNVKAPFGVVLLCLRVLAVVFNLST